MQSFVDNLQKGRAICVVKYNIQKIYQWAFLVFPWLASWDRLSRYQHESPTTRRNGMLISAILSGADLQCLGVNNANLELGRFTTLHRLSPIHRPIIHRCARNWGHLQRADPFSNIDLIRFGLGSSCRHGGIHCLFRLQAALSGRDIIFFWPIFIKHY
jgi:hypothetical protein